MWSDVASRLIGRDRPAVAGTRGIAVIAIQPGRDRRSVTTASLT
jgi:hypothetical protein